MGILRPNETLIPPARKADKELEKLEEKAALLYQEERKDQLRKEVAALERKHGDV